MYLLALWPVALLLLGSFLPARAPVGVPAGDACCGTGDVIGTAQRGRGSWGCWLRVAGSRPLWCPEAGLLAVVPRVGRAARLRGGGPPQTGLLRCASASKRQP